jgi:murein DD-endopeptidase / murein LD-carboxypeptidase
MLMRDISGKTKIIILLVAVFQLFYSSCSKTLYKEESASRKSNTREDIKVSGTKKLTVPTDNQIEKNKLKKFLDSGTGKPIDIKNATPEEIIKTARLYIGTPHCMGGTSKKCIDCSGLLLVVFAKYGVHLPHNSQEQARYGKKISRMEDLQKGDLVFFKQSYKTTNYITHSAIYVGDNKMIHASANDGVTITSLADRYWYPKFVFGTRIFH